MLANLLNRLTFFTVDYFLNKTIHTKEKRNELLHLHHFKGRNAIERISQFGTCCSGTYPVTITILIRSIEHCRVYCLRNNIRT